MLLSVFSKISQKFKYWLGLGVNDTYERTVYPRIMKEPIVEIWTILAHTAVVVVTSGGGVSDPESYIAPNANIAKI